MGEEGVVGGKCYWFSVIVELVSSVYTIRKIHKKKTFLNMRSSPKRQSAQCPLHRGIAPRGIEHLSRHWIVRKLHANLDAIADITFVQHPGSRSKKRPNICKIYLQTSGLQKIVSLRTLQKEVLSFRGHQSGELLTSVILVHTVYYK
jgi:hypothetical protein